MDRENPRRPHAYINNCRQQSNTESESKCLPQGRNTDCPVPNGYHIIQTEQVVFINTYVYQYVCRCLTIINEKGGHEFERQ